MLEITDRLTNADIRGHFADTYMPDWYANLLVVLNDVAVSPVEQILV